jgi:hypothetical protein
LKQELTFLLTNPEITKYPGQYDQSLQTSFSGITPELQGTIKKIADDYASAMGADFKEMMTSRGFRLVQIVKDQKMATFGQREQSNFALAAKVSIELSEQIASQEEPSQNYLTGNWKAGMRAGGFAVKSRIDLEAYEPLTWQLMWVKSVETDEMHAPFTYKWNHAGKSGGYAVGSDTRPQALATLLQQSYNDTMEKLYTYLDPDEFTMLSVNAQEIRKKSAGTITR